MALMALASALPSLAKAGGGLGGALGGGGEEPSSATSGADGNAFRNRGGALNFGFSRTTKIVSGIVAVFGGLIYLKAVKK